MNDDVQPIEDAIPSVLTRETLDLSAGLDAPSLLGLVETQEAHLEIFQERIAELELELEDIGWQREVGRAAFEFSAMNVMRIINWSRIMYLKNPLINHGAETQADYVWSQGVTFACKNGEGKFKQSMDDFLNHPKNISEMTDILALWAKDVRLTTEGNIFFAVFLTPGKPCIIRTVPVEDIIERGDIICNPQDRREPWFYKRVWVEEKLDLATGETTKTARTDYYPDWRYNPKKRPKRIGSSGAQPITTQDTAIGEVHWDIKVMHVKHGGTDEMKYGIPETYQALPWARAAVRDLEDYASIKRALARFAWNVSTKGGKPAIDAVRSKLKSTVSSSSPVERNPAPAVASTWAGNEGYKLDPIRTAGAQPDSNSGRAIRVMVGTGLGLPDTILSGDASVGSLATSKTLDRPTELKMRRRQAMWASVLYNMIALSIASQQKIDLPDEDGLASFTEADGTKKEYKNLAADFGLDINFPPILERDAEGRVSAVISAATLDGKTSAHMMTDKVLVSLLAQALGMDNELDELLAKLKFDDEDMLEPTKKELEKQAQDLALGVPPGAPGAPGGPVPGPNPGAPPDRKAQALGKNEPGATATEFPLKEIAEWSDAEVLAAIARLRARYEEATS